MRRKSSGTIEEEMKILRRMGRLLPPGCGLARRDRGETVGRRAPKFRPLVLGSPVRDRARSSPRIAQRRRAYGGKNLPKTEISDQRCISADVYARKLCICRIGLERSRSTAFSWAAGCAAKRSERSFRRRK